MTEHTRGPGSETCATACNPEAGECRGARGQRRDGRRGGRSFYLLLAGTLLAGLLSPSSLWAQKRGVILPVDAPSAMARTLDREIQAQVARQGLDGVMGPSQAREQLRGQRSKSFKVSMNIARRQIDEAEQHTLFMRRSVAVGSARAAITSLEVLNCALLYPLLMARAHEVLALALLLQPEDDGGAVEAFRWAIDADPAYQLNPNRRTSKALRLVKQARRRWRVPRKPSVSEISSVAQHLSVTRLVWLSARGGDDALAMTATLFDQHGAALSTRRIKGVPSGEALAKAASLVIQLLDPPRAQGLLVGSKVPLGVKAGPLPSKTPAPRDQPRRWYKKWWVWTAVGVALVGAGVGIAFAVQGDAPSPSPGAVDIEFNF